MTVDGDRLCCCPGREGQRLRLGAKSARPWRVPLVVAYTTVTVWPLAADRVTVKVAGVVPALPSVTVTSLIDRRRRVVVGDGADAAGVAEGGVAAPLRLTGKVSLASSSGRR